MTHAPSSNVASWLTSSPHTISPSIDGIGILKDDRNRILLDLVLIIV